MGLVNSYGGLIVARFFLGVAEAGFFPAATYLLTIWYRRYEVQRRMAVFYAAASLSGAFSGLLAYAISKMDGVADLAGWKWIFILEGLLPIVVSFTLYFLLPDNPETAKFLTKREREFVINRIALYTGSGMGRTTNTDKVQWKFIKAAFSDWKVFAAVIPFWACSIGTYGCKCSSDPLFLILFLFLFLFRVPADVYLQLPRLSRRLSSRWDTPLRMRSS